MAEDLQVESVSGTTAPTENSSHSSRSAGTYAGSSKRGTAYRWWAAYWAGASGLGSAAIVVAICEKADTSA